MAKTLIDRLDINILKAWRDAASRLALPIASVLQSYVERHFHTGMRPGLRRVRGRIIGRGERNRTRMLYRNTGRLARSFVPRSRDNILKVERDSIVYGTRVPYAAFHEYGTSRFIARPFLAPALRGVMRDRILEQVITEIVGYAAGK